MNKNLISHWNKSQLTIPDNKKHSAYAQVAESQLTKESTICDLGSGKGSDALYFLNKGHFVIALDISNIALESLIVKARKLHLEKNLITTQVDLNYLKIPLNNNSVDCLYSRLSIHYFSMKNSIAILRETNRILKPGGKAFIVIKSPNDKSEMEYLKSSAVEKELGVFSDKDGLTKSRFSAEQWNNILKNAGISNSNVGSFIEDLTGRTDKTKSGNTKFFLTEIRFTKDDIKH